MIATNTKKRPLFSSLRLVVSLGMVLGVAGATALHTDDVSAKGPTTSTDKNGNYWCEFDSALGGRKDQGPFNSSKGKPDCVKVCKATANGTNCDEAVTTFTPDPIKAPSKKEKHKQH